MNTTTIDKFFIVSLPRTGTKSVCRMAALMGMEFKHVPSTTLPRLLNEGKVQLFADTPVFTPSTFIPLIDDPSHKFIYINRPLDEWLESFERVGMPGNYMALHTDKIPENAINKLDRVALEEIFSNEDYTPDIARHAYQMHQNAVFSHIPADRLLVYWFSDGWTPLADFVGRVTPPDADLPHINQNTMYDVIEH